MKKLDTDQLEAFDQEYVTDDGWRAFTDCIRSDFPEGRFHLLDIGGGNGKFADRILREFPEARVTLMDNAENLLAKNTLHPNKTVLALSAEHLGQLPKHTFDIISINWVLHHLVGKNYVQSRRFIEQTLLTGRDLLRPGGRFSIFENLYNGRWLKNAPSHIIFFLTSLKILAPLTRRMGANTAGVGVCFLSYHQWRATFEKTGLRVLRYSPVRRMKIQKPLKRYLLHLGDTEVGHFWIQ